MNENEKKIVTNLMVNLIVIITTIIGGIFLFMMISDFIEFGSTLELLRVAFGIPKTIFYSDPQLSVLIREGYWILAKDKLIIFIPIFIIAIIIKIGGNKIIKIREF